MNLSKTMVIGPARRKLKKPPIKKMPKKGNQPISKLQDSKFNTKLIKVQDGDECKKPRKFPHIGDWVRNQYRYPRGCPSCRNTPRILKMIASLKETNPQRINLEDGTLNTSNDRVKTFP